MTDDLDRLVARWWANAAEDPGAWRRWIAARAEGHHEWPTVWPLAPLTLAGSGLRAMLAALQGHP